MSLRRAIMALPDDRETVSAARSVISFLSKHPNEPLSIERVARATGLAQPRADAILRALSEAFVVDCVGSKEPTCMFAPSPTLDLEVQRFLRASSSVDARLKSSTERFRGRYGSPR